MPTYASWNTAIAKFFTSNVQRGASVFLTLNDDALHEIAANFLGDKVSAQGAAGDFVDAVREQVVTGNCVSIGSIAVPTTGQAPKGVAFLGLMVLAAHRMAGDDEISAINYFTRLTQLLQVASGNGNRPAGLGTGNEQILWIEWNQWLQLNGWQPTARHGPEGPRKYLNYVLTQALVRDDDKLYLQKRFRENQGRGGITRTMDEVQLAGWLQRSEAITRPYLRAGFRSSDPRRSAAFYEAAYRVYEATNWAGGPALTTVQRSRLINAGLLRSVSLVGDVTYRLFVPQPTNWMPKSLHIHPGSGGPLKLIPGRAGHFQPLWKCSPFVAESIRMKLEGDALLDAVAFPHRDFWILTPDPEDPTGALATWEKFPNLLGQKFILLCPVAGDQAVQEEMERFRTANLMNWDGEPRSVLNGTCHEYRGCMVISPAWDGFVPSEHCPDLFEALKPRQFATISLAGGIRAPDQNAWLVGHPPKLTIYGFEERFGLRLLSGEHQAFSCQHQRQQPLGLDPALPAGIYTLEADWNGQVLATRSFRLIAWNTMESTPNRLGVPSVISAAGKSILLSGAIIQEQGPQSTEAKHV